MRCSSHSEFIICHLAFFPNPPLESVTLKKSHYKDLLHSSLIFCSSPFFAFCNFPWLRLLRPRLPVYFQFFSFPIWARSGFSHLPTAISGSFRPIASHTKSRFSRLNSMSGICVGYMFRFLYNSRHNFRYPRYTPVSPQVSANRVPYIFRNAFTCFSCTRVLNTSGAPGTSGTHKPLSA